MLKPIPGFDGYSITTNGRVFSHKHNRMLSPKIDKYGYVVFSLYKDGKSFYRTAHRLVAMTYIDNPSKLPCVNHINEDKTDNHVSNLEWCTHRYNNNYGTRNTRMAKTKCKRPVIRTLLDGTEIKYDGVKDAWRKTGIAWSQIARACQNKNSSWRYANETN